MHRLPRVAGSLFLGVASAVFVACGGEGGASDSEQVAAAAALFTETPAQTLPMDMTDLKFSRPALTVRAGEVVEVALANRGATEHDFSIASLPGEKAFRVGGKDTAAGRGGNEVHAHLKRGQTGTVRLKPSTPGTYEFYCTVAGHKAAGMKGTLTVQ